MMKQWLEQVKEWFQEQIARLESSRVMDGTHKEHDEHHYARLGWIIVLVGFGGFMLWALFAPLDQGVSAQGTVMSDGYAKVVQPVVGGRVEAILVKDGEHVEEGQVLLRLNDIQATAQYNVAREEISGLEQKITALENSKESKQVQLRTISEQLKNNRELAKEGYVPKSKVLDLERMQAQVAGAIHDDTGQLEYIRRQLNETKEKYKSFEYDLSNAEVKSPVSGTVVNTAQLTVGAVISAGTKVMSVVPNNEALQVEAMLPVHLIDNVYPGLNVEMLFPAFDQTKAPRIPGELQSISADRLMDERQGPYYKVKVQVTPEGMRLLGNNRIRPGMPVEVFIITGERTMMSYLLKPLLDRSRSALRER